MKISFFVFFLSIFIVTGCIKKKDAALHVQLSTEPVSLDPSLVEDGGAFRVLAPLMHGLFRYDGKGTLVHALAEKVSVSSQNKRFVYKVLLKKVQWSDGVPVTAQHFVDSIERTLNPSTPSKLVDLLYVIENAKAYREKKILFSSVGVSAKSDLELEFILNKPISYFAHLLALPIFYPQRKEAPGKVTTGPYFLKEWKIGEKFLLEKNPYYKDFPEQAPKQIVFQIIPEEITALQLFKTGKLQILTKAPYTDLQELQKKGLVRSFPFRATYYIGINHRVKPWNSEDLRCEFSESVDREGIMQILNGDGIPSHHWAPQTGVSSNSAIHAKTGFLRKLKLLDENTRELSFDGGHRNKLIAEKIQGDFLKKYDVKLELKTKDWKTHIQNLTAYPTALFRFGWMSPFLHPIAHYLIFKSDNPNNYTGWKNPEYDKIIEAMETAADENHLKELAAKADSILTEKDCVIAALYHYKLSFVVSGSVKYIEINELGLIDFLTLVWQNES